MKVSKKSNKVIQQIDPDTGLPTSILRTELLKGVNSPTVKMGIDDVKEHIKRSARTNLK